ncbi:hypothetical protein [Sphingobacterium bambusae]|uniref:Uncharacterized protein n=1 Tax=Sphingobacterium bambusae TaxID=662858 RepID=A0ABW6BFS6_9SPHI|nr:hypothetical protein [Sphingobacterium bambusae]WPL50364.1 hypothetical protein SCB77_07865 [Sphingobacterium bambusae]
MHKLLITYGTRPFAQRIGKVLAAAFECHYASSESFPELLLKGNFRKIPTGANPTFAHELLKLALDEDYRYVLPLGKMELQVLHETRVLFEEYGISLLLPDELLGVRLLENPPSTADIHILNRGVDMLTNETMAEPPVSGAVVLSDEGDEPILCIV